jgi:hypothetical protein
MAGSINQQQINAFFEIVNNSKLNTELVELLQVLDNDNFFEIQKGTDDAKAIRVPAARGYLGEYDADTNDPNLGDGTGIDGDYYIISVAGTRDFGSGAISFLEDDFVKYVDGIWRKAMLVTNTSQLVNDSSDAINFYTSFVTIGGYKFILHKLDLDPLKRLTLEVGDDIVGKDDTGGMLMARYKGGTVTDFRNDAVWERWGGY